MPRVRRAVATGILDQRSEASGEITPLVGRIRTRRMKAVALTRYLPIKPQGKIALIVGTEAPLPPGALMRKSITVAWELMFTRAIFGTPDMIEQHRLLDRAAELVDAGVLHTTLKEQLGRIDAANLRRAHAAIESGRTIGKLALAGF